MDFFFIQMTDPQLGLFASLSGMDEGRILDLRQQMGWKIRPAPKTTSFPYETELYEKAIAAANRLNPAFVVVTGDMVQDKDDPAQLAELWRITGQLGSHIPVHWTPGNWDVGNTPTPESLAQYRETFGEDHYAFDYGSVTFIVLNSSVGFDDSQMAQEWDRQVAFLGSSIKEAKAKEQAHKVVLMHHPLFAQTPDEENSWAAISRDKRQSVLDLLECYCVSAVFSGHWHRNHHVNHRGIQMVTTGAVGYPLGDDPSGLRIVKVFGDRIEHEYYGLDEIPDKVE